jgi:hypothetical protein
MGYFALFWCETWVSQVEPCAKDGFLLAYFCMIVYTVGISYLSEEGSTWLKFVEDIATYQIHLEGLPEFKSLADGNKSRKTKT